jgi:hypothetical protein
MKMLVVALIGGVVLGFVDAKFLVAEVAKMFGDPNTQNLVTTCLAAFLGVLWGWVAKGMVGGKAEK